MYKFNFYRMHAMNIQVPKLFNINITFVVCFWNLNRKYYPSGRGSNWRNFFAIYIHFTKIIFECENFKSIGCPFCNTEPVLLKVKHGYTNIILNVNLNILRRAKL